MASARVELVRAVSHSHGGHTFRKGESKVLTTPGDIAYYKAQPEFSVRDLKDPPKPKTKAAPKPAAAPIKHDRVSLEKLTKLVLISTASNPPFNLGLDNEMKKGDMIDAMLLQLEVDGEGDGDDDGDDAGDDGEE